VITPDEYLKMKCKTEEELRLALKLKDKLYKLRNSDDYVLGALVNAGVENRKTLFEIIEEHPKASSDRIALVALGLGEYSKMTEKERANHWKTQSVN